MRLAARSACLLMTVLAATARAQHYDPFYVQPGPAGRIAVDACLFASSVSDAADASRLIAVGKYAVDDETEVGASVDLGLLQDGAGALSRVQVGAKRGLSPSTAVTAALLVPVGDAQDPGVSVGWMKTTTLPRFSIDTWATAGLLDGYVRRGVDLSLLVEPRRPLGDAVTVYLGVTTQTNTEAPGDGFALDVRPSADLNLSETAIVNAGLTVGVAGDRKANHVGLRVSALTAF